MLAQWYERLVNSKKKTIRISTADLPIKYVEIIIRIYSKKFVPSPYIILTKCINVNKSHTHTNTQHV